MSRAFDQGLLEPAELKMLSSAYVGHAPYLVLGAWWSSSKVTWMSFQVRWPRQTPGLSDHMLWMAAKPEMSLVFRSPRITACELLVLRHSWFMPCLWLMPPCAEK